MNEREKLKISEEDKFFALVLRNRLITTVENQSKTTCECEPRSLSLPE